MFHATELLGQDERLFLTEPCWSSGPDVSSTHPSAWLLLFTQIRSGIGPERLAVRVFDRMVAVFYSFWAG